MIDQNDVAPDFLLPCDEGGDVALSGLRSAPVVLFFYPRDNTPGCTTEAIDFTSLKGDFDAEGARILGISKDSLESHAKFRKKQGLGIVLVSDAEGHTCEDYGVWREKNMYGKTFMGIERTTVLIDAQGHIAQIWRKVKVKGHAQEVLQAVRAL